MYVYFTELLCIPNKLNIKSKKVNMKSLHTYCMHNYVQLLYACIRAYNIVRIYVFSK